MSKHCVRMIVGPRVAPRFLQPPNQRQWQLQLSLAPNRITINSDLRAFERI